MDRSKLHVALKPVLFLAQIFGLFPINGVLSDDHTRLTFKWTSFKMLWSLTAIAGAIFLLAINVHMMMRSQINFGDFVTIIFYSSTSLSMVLFIAIAVRWGDFIRRWSVLEVSMRKCDYQPDVVRTFRMNAATVMVLALGEHLMYVAKVIDSIKDCPLLTSQPIKTYFGASFTQFFTIVKYQHWKAVLIEAFNIFCTFAWNFSDLFIILMSVAVFEKFKQLNVKIGKTKIKNDKFWRHVREDYDGISVLCAALNKILSILLTLSFANNLFFICVQLFNTLNPMGSTINTVYFIFSFGFLIGRTFSVSIYASRINVESKRMLNDLFNIPSEAFGPEAHRLIEQISNSPVALSGIDYFFITRDFCVKLAGTIITFELVLLQVGPMFLNTNRGPSTPFCIA